MPVTVTTEQVWKEYHARLRRFVGKHVDDPSVTDDLLQEIFMRVHGNIATLRADHGLQGWLYRGGQTEGVRSKELMIES